MDYSFKYIHVLKNGKDEIDFKQFSVFRGGENFAVRNDYYDSYNNNNDFTQYNSKIPYQREKENRDPCLICRNDKIKNFLFIIERGQWKLDELFKNVEIVKSVDFIYHNISNNYQAACLSSLKNMFYNCKNLNEVNFFCKIGNNHISYLSNMFYGCENLNKVFFKELFCIKTVESMDGIFYGCSSLEKIDLFKLYFDEEDIKVNDKINKNKKSIFRGSLKNISKMFYGCEELEECFLPNISGTSLIEDMSYMFYGCSSLTSLNLSNFNTNRVTNMSNMFYGCSSLKNLDLSNFETDGVTNMSYMFCGCTLLKELNLSNFNTCYVTDMSEMFKNCLSLKELLINKKFLLPLESKNIMFNCKKQTKDLFFKITDNNKNYLNKIKDGQHFSIKLSFDCQNKFTNDDIFNRKLLEDYEYMVCFDDKIILNKKEFESKHIYTLLNYYNKYIKNNEKNIEIEILIPLKIENLSYFCISNNIVKVVFKLFNDRSVPQINNYSSMFQFCENLVLVNFNNFNTENATNMSYMFSGCKNLIEIQNSENLKINNVINMEAMFYGCFSLKELSIVSNPAEGVRLDNIFTNCDNLKKIYLYIPNKQLNCNFIHECGSIENLKFISKNNNTSKTENKTIYSLSSLFENCNKLKSIEGIENLIFETIYYANRMFYGCKNLTYVNNFCDGNFCDGNFTNLRDASFMFSGCSSLKSINLSKYNLKNLFSMANMFSGCSSLESANLSGVNLKNLTNMSNMFSGCSSLESANLLEINAKNKLNMSYMFYGCKNLKKVDFSGKEHPSEVGFSGKEYPLNVENMNYMFYECLLLPGIKFYDSFTFEYLDFMNYTFYGCSSLELVYFHYPYKIISEDGKILPPKEMNANRLLTMIGTFSGCSSLKSLDLSHLVTNKLMNMGNMFSGCSSLELLNLSNFDTSNVTYMGNMFSGCSSLNSLDLSSFDTSNVNNMSNMFSGCSSLTSLNLSNFDTSNVKNMSNMFSGCLSLASLGISNFNTSKVTNMNNMFSGCLSLTPSYKSNDVTSLNFYIKESIFDSKTEKLDEGMIMPVNATHDGTVGINGSNILCGNILNNTGN